MKKKWIAVLAGLACCAVAFTGCRESTRARYNVQKQADYFNVERRLTVINARSDKPVLEMVGYFPFPIMLTMNLLSHWKPDRMNTKLTMFT